MKTIAEIKAEFNNCDLNNLDDFIKLYSDDKRAGVAKILESAFKKIDAHNKELERLELITQFEKKYQSMGVEYVGGIDERSLCWSSGNSLCYTSKGLQN